MIKSLLNYSIGFVLLVLAQVLLFNNIELGGFLNPYFYVLFILVLPFETPRWLLLILGFGLGITIDIFSETIGMHTMATVFMAYLRPIILSMFSPREGYEAGSYPRVHYYGMRWFLQYALVLVLAHHTVLFLAEMFSLHDLFRVILRIILSTLFTGSLICISQYFVFRK